MLTAFGLRSAVPEGYMLATGEAGDNLVIELCSGIDTKFVRLNLATGETETIDPEDWHDEDDQPTATTEQCLGAINIDLDVAGSLDRLIAEVFARTQAVVVLRRLTVARSIGLPTLPARGPPILF